MEEVWTETVQAELETMDDHCSLCQRQREHASELCGLHTVALVNLENAHSSWSNAYGAFSETEYYAKLESLTETGTAVKDVVRYLREKRAEVRD